MLGLHHRNRRAQRFELEPVREKFWGRTMKKTSDYNYMYSLMLYVKLYLARSKIESYSQTLYPQNWDLKYIYVNEKNFLN